jgi:two-component system, cell cycle response regulator DivK
MKPKILLVEDNPDSRDILVKMLELDGYSVIAAEDGLAGLRMAEREMPDAIVTDIHMPKLDGIQMVELIRNRPELSAVPIVAITAFGSDMMAKAVEAGADAALAKPLDYEVLVNRIEQLLTKGFTGDIGPSTISGMAAPGL